MSKKSLSRHYLILLKKNGDIILNFKFHADKRSYNHESRKYGLLFFIVSCAGVLRSDTVFVCSDKKLATRVMSPPSYAAPSSMPARSPTRSPSRSPSPETGDNIQFITSFGGEEEEKPREFNYTMSLLSL